MNRGKLGASLVSLWAGLNLTLAAGILVAIGVLGQQPPSLRLFCTAAEVQASPASVLGVVRGLAYLFNACAVGLCGAVLWLVWARARTDRAVALALASATCFVQLFGFVSDAALGSTHLVANAASTLVLVAGWGLVLSAHFTGRKSPVI